MILIILMTLGVVSSNPFLPSDINLHDQGAAWFLGIDPKPTTVKVDDDINSLLANVMIKTDESFINITKNEEIETIKVAKNYTNIIEVFVPSIEEGEVIEKVDEEIDSFLNFIKMHAM
jgi:hypothetical protein